MLFAEKDMLNLFKPQVLPNFEIFELENVCRICLHSATKMLSLFYNEIDSLISEFLPQKLYRKPLQPHQICAKCFEQGKSAYIFKKQCEYSDELIKSMLNEHSISKTYYEKQTQTDYTNIYPCEKCEKKFKSSEILKEHRLKKHQNTPNICRTCGKVYKTITTLRSHLISVHPELGFDILCKYKCHLCEDNFTRKSKLKRHLFRVHNIKEYFVTNDTINGANEEDDFVFLKTVKYEFSCGNCLENFAVEDDLKNHECTSCLYEKGLEGNSSNGMQLINDCDKNKIEVVFVSEENNKSHSVFDDNLKTENEHEENTIEKNKEIFTSEIKIETENIFAEEMKVSQKIVGAVITEPKEKIIREVQPNVGPKRYFPATARAKPLLCSECGISFSRLLALEDHIRTHTGEKPYICQYCDRAFAKQNNLNRHKKTHTGNKDHHCPNCPKTFSTSFQLKVHLRTHTGERPYKCSYCSMAFVSKLYLKQHHRKHTGERGERRFCDLCSSSYSTSNILLNHKRKVHGIDETKEFSCKYCSEKIIGAIEYEKHRQACHAKPQQAILAKPHQTVSAKPHICLECGKSFKTSEYLKLHIRTHTGEKPYKCQYCDRAFSKQSNLDRHKKIHTGEKNHHCKNCPKTFISSGELKVHMRTHTGERPYKCSFCPMAFSENRSLKKHREKHASE